MTSERRRRSVVGLLLALWTLASPRQCGALNCALPQPQLVGVENATAVQLPVDIVLTTVNRGDAASSELLFVATRNGNNMPWEQRITINTPGRHRILAIVDALSSECSRTDFFVFDGYLPESNGGTDIESLQVECSMAPELHLLAFWSTMPEDRLVRLIRVLSAMSDVVNYPDANYHVRLHGVVRVDPGTANYIDESWYEEFYGDTYYGLYFGTDDKVDMMRVKGGGAFHVALVEDTCPKYAYDLGRDTILSTNMFALKRLLREQSPHWYQVHATQTRQESDADFKFLFGDTGRNAFHSLRLDMLWSPDKHDGRRTDNGVYVLSWKRVFIPVDVMEVFGAMMQSEWYRIELDVPEIHAELTPGMLDPNPTSSQENILRVAFLGLTRIPLLAHLPTDSQWYKGLLELRHVKRFHVLKETKWGKVVPACSTVGEAAAILSSQDTTSEDCPLRDHVRQLQHRVDHFNHTVIVVGASVDGPFTIWDGNHRAITLALTRPDSHLLLVYMGVSAKFAAPYRSTLFCS